MNQKILPKGISWWLSRSLLKGILLMVSVFSITFAHAQSTVSGKVVDETGTAMPGVNIVVKGTSNGTTSDNNGAYTILVPSTSQTLVFSFIGYSTKEEVIGSRTTIDISMQLDAEQLSEVVVIGYGTQRKEAVTGSVASISGDVIRDIPTGNVTQALQGRLAGVELTQTSTKPGASMQIRVRGSRSLTASNDPLVVLNGIPFSGSIGDINPADIKSIDILKDASATAIYGSRGANGVILVTTNTGQKGQKPQFSYSSYVGAKTVFAPYPMMEGPKFVKMRADAGIYSTNGADESDDVNTDWQDLNYGTGIITSHDIGVSGGTQNGSYSFGAGYFHDESVLAGQDYNRFSIRGSLDQEIGNYFRFGFTSNNNFSINNGNSLGTGDILNKTPIANPYNPDGSLKRTVVMAIDESWVQTRESIENLGDAYKDQTKAYGSYNNIYGEVKIPWVDGLKYRANLGLNLRTTTGGYYRGEGVFSTNATTQSTATINNSLTTDWIIENLLTYDHTFAQKHDFNVVALYSAQQSNYNSSNISALDIPSDAFQYYNLGQALGNFTINPDYQGYSQRGLVSWMGRAMYSYDDKYMVTATVRSDASSVLAPGHKWHTYTAISAGWNIKGEQFMSNVDVLDKLKLRVGYGQTSNQGVNPYSTLGRLNTRPYNFGDTDYAVGYYVSELPNENLGWEYSSTWNVGVDFGMLNNRLSGTIEYYITDTKDLLLSVGLPATSGVGSYTANVGKTQNKGIEITLNGLILDNANGWTWEAGLNFYSNRNELVSLSSGVNENVGNSWFVGHPIDVIYDYEAVGIWQENDPYRAILEPGPLTGSGSTLGMIKVKYTGDFNPDGTPTRAIGPDDRQIIEVPAKFQGGFNTRVSYKGFDLSLIAAFKSGGTLISSLYGSGGYLNLMGGRGGNVDVDYWTPENTDAKYPSPSSIRSGDNVKYASTMGYFDASYLKIRTITLGYSFNQDWMANAGLNNLRVYFTLQNPLVMFSPYHKESGMDPETNSYGNENAAVALPYSQRRLLTIGTNTPSTRNYVFGLNLTF